jgi:cobalt-zinc-cadmium efflux system protein
VSGHADTLHDASGSARRERRLAIVFALNILIVAGQAIGGVAAGSLSLVADAGHNLTDVAAVALSWWTVRLARRRPTQRSDPPAQWIGSGRRIPVVRAARIGSSSYQMIN